MYYLLNESLRETEKPEEVNEPYIAIIDSRQWEEENSSYGLGPDISNIENSLGQLTKVIFSADCIGGTFLVPDSENNEHYFGFVLDKDRLVFVDDTNYVRNIIRKITEKKKTYPSSTAEFLYDFIDELTEDDIDQFNKLEKELDMMEIELVNKRRASSVRISEIRSVVRKYMIYYEQMENALSEMIENENGMFDKKLIHYLKIYQDRIERLYDIAADIREYSQEIRELRKEMIDMRQNNINTAIAVVTSIFLPLNLIAGWYGMNFKNMPELQWHYSYYVVMGVSVLIVTILLLIFKKKRWL